MEVTISHRRENRSLDRTELLCDVSFDKAVPSRKELREAIVASVGCDPSCLIIVSVKGRFGCHTAKVRAHIYKTKEALLATERHHLLVRDGLAEKKKEDKK
ncbi:MAG: hypothetical protein QXN37_02860 [Candidatus Anstonellaceae archaeon]